MAILGLGLILIGALIALVGWVMILIEAFKESVLWGLGSLFIGIVGLIFVIMHFEQTKKGLFIYLGGAVLIGIGICLGAMGAPADVPTLE